MGFKTATVYIVRHGETIGNDTKLVMHPSEDVLNEAGRVQAANLGESLKQVQFTGLYTSTYPRTIETGDIILSKNSKSSKNLPKKTDERLREVEIEKMHGKPYAELLGPLLVFLNSKRPLDEFTVGESEPIPSVRKRTKEFLMDLIKDVSALPVDGQTFLVVSHGACIRLLLEHFTDADSFTVEGMDETALKITRNTGCTKLSIKVPDNSEGDKLCHVKFETIHDYSHIPKETLEKDSLIRLTKTPEGQALSGCFHV